MQVAVNNSNQRAGALRFSLSMAFMLVFCFASAQAQSDAASKPVTGEGGSSSSAEQTSDVQKTRARRTAETTAAESEAGASEEVSAASEEVTAPEKGVDRLSALRAQIADARNASERTRLQRMLVDYLVALNRKSEAVNELRAMSREERLDPIGFYNIGNALARLGDTDTAIDAYRKAINQRHGNYARAFNNLGVLLLRQGRWDDAQQALISALRLENFHYSEASYNLGRVYAARGEADLAIREWSRALAVQPDHTDAAIALARALAEDGDAEKGIALLDRFITRRGPTSEIIEARREIMFGDGPVTATATASAAPAASAASRNTAPPTIARDNSAMSAAAVSSPSTKPVKASPSKSEKSDNNKRAAASLRRLTVDRESYDWLKRARQAREEGRGEEAATFYSRVLARNGGVFAPANLELGFVLSGLKRYDEAAQTFAALAGREGSRYPIAYYHLGRQYELLGKFGLAAEAYEKAVAAYGEENPQFLLDLSRVREKDGNAGAALAAMESYVRLSQKLGRVPDWTAERLAELRQKAKQ
ncbi:MAG TPA: tetratricopeptide repeat protein [Pyrinomonadaceae bacterium]